MLKKRVAFGALAATGLLLVLGLSRRDFGLIGSSDRFSNYRIPDDRICLGAGWNSSEEVRLLLFTYSPHPPPIQDLVFLDRRSPRVRVDSTGNILNVSAGTPSLVPSYVSPDGRYVFEGSSIWRRYLLRALSDGNQRVPIPYFGGVPVWRADSQEWLEYRAGRNGAITTFSIESPRPRTYNVSLRHYEFVLWFDLNGRVVTTNSGGSSNLLDMREITLQQRPIDRRFQLRLPNGSTFVNALVSPEGTRVVWQVKSPPAPIPWPQVLLMRFGWNRSVPPQEEDVLCASRTDGTGMTEVGGVPVEADEKDRLRILSWQPDGKSVCFTYRRSLYVKALE